jgi:hypothetical protein
MKNKAYQVDLMGVGTGVVEGEQEVILRFQPRGGGKDRNYSLSWEDATELAVVLARLVVEQAEQRNRIESN